MAENDDNSINNDNNNNPNNNDNEERQRGFLEDVLHHVTTPIRVIREIRDLEEHLGLERTALFQDYDTDNNNPTSPAQPEQPEAPEDRFTMPITKYSLGGMSLEFDSETPTPNTDYDVGVVISKANRPAQGSDDETKLIERLCKNQYPKYKKAETSMKSVERLLQSRGITATINGTKTLLDKYDMMQTFTIVLPTDPTLTKVALTSVNGVPTTFDLLVDFRKVTKEQVALSCAWWNLHGFYLDNDDKKISLSRDMNWSYLHFKNHVEDVLYDDVNKEFHDDFEKKQRGGPLFFKLLVDKVITSNENSLSALVSTIKKYKIDSDGKDDLPECLKVLEAGVNTIMAMREDGSNRSPLPDKFVVDLIAVLQTTSVPVFNEKMKDFHSSLDMDRLKSGETTINTLLNLQQTFAFAKNYHKELFDEGIWHAATIEQAKSTFIFWKNRCWNCKQENCSVPRCNKAIDKNQIEINKQEWMKENNRDSTDFKGQGRRTNKPIPKNWRPPEPQENNKRIIYGKPYTWNGVSSWILDKTPESGLTETPGLNVADGKLPDLPTGGIPSQIHNDDDATVMTAATGLTQEQNNEIRRIQANIKNLGANLAAIFKQE
jgi:hypothetical protein